MRTTPTVGGSLKTELPRTKPGAQQQYRCGADNCQRYDLLPIHARKIISNAFRATNHFLFQLLGTPLTSHLSPPTSQLSTAFPTLDSGLWTNYSPPVSARFRHIYRVVYADCTIGNHIYYSRYLDILEAARGEFFRHLGVPLFELQARDTLFPVIECHLRYKSSARYDDILTIELWTTQVHGARLNFGFRILKDEKVLILEGETCHVCTGVNEKPKRIPEDLVQKLATSLNELNK